MLFADEMMALDIDFENMEPLMVLAELASQLSAVTAAVSAEPELMTIDVFCCHQYDVNALEVHSDTTVGDLYIDVSAKTSLPMCCFRLVHNYDILPAGMLSENKTSGNSPRHLSFKKVKYFKYAKGHFC